MTGPTQETNALNKLVVCPRGLRSFVMPFSIAPSRNCHIDCVVVVT